jgi:AraC family transcriptional regulator
MFMGNQVLNISTHLENRKLEQLVENRTAYTLEQIELSIYETHKTIYDVAFQFNVPVLASMIRGKKIMHVDGKPPFEFIPGQSMILSPGEPCVVDFPEASESMPTECLKLAIDPAKISKFCEQMNGKYPIIDNNEGWLYKADGDMFLNDAMINQLLNRLILICTENNVAKDFFANLVVQELLVRLMQTKARNVLLSNYQTHSTSNRFAHVSDYIQKNLHENINIKTLSKLAYMSEPHFFRCFKQEFGVTPVEFILEMRIKAAKAMLETSDLNLKGISFSCGFNSLNYFLKIFKRYTGHTPAQYRRSLLA